MNKEDTITARATTPGESAIAVIRISGVEAIQAANALTNGACGNMVPNEMRFQRIYDNEKVLDEAMVAVFKAPHSFTGEDSVEFYIHGSEYISRRMLQLLVSNGVRLAEPGEFTMRAYFNGKIDLVQAEAIADIIASQTEQEHKLALSQLRGGVSTRLSLLRQQMLEFAALLELELDFGEEDVEFADRNKLLELLHSLESDIGNLSESFEAGNAIKNGIPVAIVGKPNAGKSTLLNAILGEERAIVTEVPGTTRDTIEETIILEGMRFRFMDTAGIRTATDKVEAIGIERSIASIEKAMIVLCIYDAATVAQSELQELKHLTANHPVKQVWFVANKTDIASPLVVDGYPNIAVQARDKEIGDLKAALIRFGSALSGASGDTTISNVRHFAALQSTLQAVQEAKSALISGISGDRLAQHIRQAMSEVGKITGEIDNDQVLTEIFSKFCIGK